MGLPIKEYLYLQYLPKTAAWRKLYHKPSDEYDAATCTMDGAIKDLKLLFKTGMRSAFETGMPQWKEGSEFKAVREGKK